MEQEGTDLSFRKKYTSVFLKPKLTLGYSFEVTLVNENSQQGNKQSSLLFLTNYIF